jgi:hypothetical protein
MLLGVERKDSKKAMQNVIMKKNLPVKGLWGRFYLSEVQNPIHIIHRGKGRGGEVGPERRLEGATVHKAGSKISTCLTVSSL